MRKFLALTATFLLLTPQAWCFCQTLPRLICAEYANSKLVVIAVLTDTQYERRQDQDDAYIFTLKTIKTLRGRVGPAFRITEYNDTGRASFDWKRGQSYLLFLKPKGDGTWWLEGCGNSAPLNEANFVLKVIESLKSRKGGFINGNVIGLHSWISNAGVTIQIHGDTREFVATTDRDGNFKIHVPAGRYVIEAVQKGSSFQTSPYADEDPRDIRIEDGGCAQVIFEQTEERYRNE